MNIPDRIDITAMRKIDGELKEQIFNVPYEYNFNATNAYRKVKQIEYSEFVVMFGGLAKGNFEANEAVGELLWYSIKEGCRICFEEMPDITVEDIGRYLNSDAEVFTKVLGFMQQNMNNPESEKKKVMKVKK